MFAASQSLNLGTNALGSETADGASSGTLASMEPMPAEPVAPSDGTGSEWIALVQRIQSGDDTAMEELYRVFSKGIRFYLCRQLGTQEVDDKVHDTFLIVIQAIRRGDLREPERLMGFVRTIVRRQVAAYIGDAVQARRDHTDLEAGVLVVDGTSNPEQSAIARETIDIMKRALRDVSERDREILTRFYLMEQTQEQICEEMNLSETQFRLLKSRAKARFGESGKKKVQRGGLLGLMLRGKASENH